MKNTFACLTGLLLTTAASAATTVWSAADGNGQVPPISWYKYANETTDVATFTTTAAGEKSVAITVSTTKNSSAAGMGFALAKTGATKDLSAYDGFCLTYSATQKFRFDVKQKNVTDYDYNGIVLPAKSAQDTMFVAFSKLAQENWGEEVAFDPSMVEGVQFSYKQAIASETKFAKNTIVVSSVTLGSGCATYAPQVTDAFASYNGKILDLEEGNEHSIVLADLFTDADGDDLKITVAITSATNSLKLLNTGTSFSLKDTLHFATVANPQGPASVVITATDPTNKTAKFSFNVNAIDKENDPVAENSYYKVNENEVLKVVLSGRLAQYGSDVDGDEIKLVLVDEPTHGVLSDFNADYGTFTYTPNAKYHGFDTLTYKFVEVKNEERESNVALAIIEVVNVNDPVIVKVNAENFMYGEEKKNFGDTLVVDEDFEEFIISIPKANFTITDDDGDDDYKITAKATAVFTAALTSDEDNYLITVTAKPDSNGTGRLSLVVTDPGTSVPTAIAVVKVNAVVDPVIPIADTYTVLSDSLNKISAKLGVLANDKNPDKDTISYPVLDYSAEHGKVILAKDGSFTYEPEEGYVGEDFFAYKIVNAAGDTSSAMAMVTLNVIQRNKAPQIVEGVMDTVAGRLAGLQEDFTGIITYKKAEMQSWFKDDSTASTSLKFTVRSEDSLLNPVITTTGILQIRSVRDACGDAQVIVTAADARGATTDLVLNAAIECVNDKPVAHRDTIYVPEGWNGGEIDLSRLFTDADGDELVYDIAATTTLLEYFTWTIEENVATFSVNDGLVMKSPFTFAIKVTAADSTILATEGATAVSGYLTLIVGEDPRGIAPQKPLLTKSWKTAITASRGVAAIFDMQGRVIWKAALPVNESEVRAAAASVQGGKILRVNKQSYTIK